MDLTHLRSFVAAADAGSITRAADRLGLTQPALSQHVRRLEGHLGVDLFDRLARGVVLTDAGRALLPRAREILAAVRDTEANLLAEVKAGGGDLAIGAIPTMAPFLLPPILEALDRDVPRCTVTVREDLTERLVEAVVDHELDLALMAAPIDHPQLEVTVLGREDLLVVMPDDFELGALDPQGGSDGDPDGASPGAPDEVTIASLRDQPAVILHEMHCLGRQIQGFCAAQRLARRVVCRTTQIATVLELVRSGLGISLVPALAARADTTGGRRYVRLRRGTLQRTVVAIRRRARQPTRAATRAMAVARETLADATV